MLKFRGVVAETMIGRIFLHVFFGAMDFLGVSLNHQLARPF